MNPMRRHSRGTLRVNPFDGRTCSIKCWIKCGHWVVDARRKQAGRSWQLSEVRDCSNSESSESPLVLFAFGQTNWEQTRSLNYQRLTWNLGALYPIWNNFVVFPLPSIDELFKLKQHAGLRVTVGAFKKLHLKLFAMIHLKKWLCVVYTNQ